MRTTYKEVVANLVLMTDILCDVQEQEVKERRQERERNERNNCIRCGEPIKRHWYVGVIESKEELICSYSCPKCGCQADQHFKLIYDKTVETN